ncbi:MAG: 2-C-methyl-D-erythritol 4-phosphate cytidylyltransferase [Pirellulaceae bacterium]|nr:2-C-methyl-D-erythritol 4-phosphate cytidylyltransferase [Pirellulaceae bacterium]
MSKFAVILAAAGRSSRFGDPFQKKVFVTLAGKPLWMHSAELFAKHADVGQLVLVISGEDRELFNEKFAGHAAMLGIQTVVGGEQRADSVRQALAVINADCQWVAVHDAARPCLTKTLIDSVFQAAQRTGAAILATPCHSTLKRVTAQQTIQQTVPRDGLWLAQTPQCFKTKLLQQCYQQHPSPSQATDEASIVQECGHAVSVVEGSPLNIKVTTKGDLKFAEVALKALPQPTAFPF